MALPLSARKVLDRVMGEHMAHGGKENGSLPCTYDDFEAFGVRRKSIREAIEVAVGLGLLDVAPGGRSIGATHRPSLYRLTWLPTHDGDQPSNRWKAITTPEVAEGVITRIAAARTRRAGLRTRHVVHLRRPSTKI